MAGEGGVRSGRVVKIRVETAALAPRRVGDETGRFSLELHAKRVWALAPEIGPPNAASLKVHRL